MRPTVLNLAIYGGAAAISYGAWSWHPPAGWIVGGACAILMASFQAWFLPRKGVE